MIRYYRYYLSRIASHALSILYTDCTYDDAVYDNLLRLDVHDDLSFYENYHNASNAVL